MTGSSNICPYTIKQKIRITWGGPSGPPYSIVIRLAQRPWKYDNSPGEIPRNLPPSPS